MHLFLILHLVGLILFAGTTVIEFILWRQYQPARKTQLTHQQTFRQQALQTIHHASPQAAGQTATPSFGRISGIGAAILILSGIGMMYLTRGLYGEQTWFRIKFAIVILLIINNILARRRNKKTQTSISGNRLYFLIQFFFFIAILILSVYKFN